MVLFVCVCVCIHRMLSEAPLSCQQKYSSNKSVYCYGGNYFKRKCTYLRLSQALRKLQNVLSPPFPAPSFPVTIIRARNKVGDNKNGWALY